MNRLQRILAAAFLPAEMTALDRFGPSDPMSSGGGWFVRMLGGGKTKAGVAVSEHTAMLFPAVYACINRISNPLAMVPAKIYQTDGNGNPVEVKEHTMSERLPLRPNDFMSSRTLRKVGQSHALLWGNGYIEIERNARGEAVGLWPLLPDRTRPKRAGERLLVHTTIDGKSFEIDQGDVLHVMDLSHDGYIGISQIAMARQAIGMGLAMEEFGAKFFANDAKSGGFFMHPGKLGPQAFRNIKGRDGEEKAAPEGPRARIEKQSGLDNAHRVKVLEEGMKFIQTTIPPEDAQFLGSREFQIAEVARIYDVPLILLQSHEKTTSWGTGIEQLMIGFVRQTVQPWVTAWEQELNWKLFTEQERADGLYVKFNLKALLRGDTAARAAFYKAMFEVGGITPDQICQLEEIEPIGEGGDRRYRPMNFVPLEDAAEDDPEPPPPLGRLPAAPSPIEEEEEEPA